MSGSGNKGPSVPDGVSGFYRSVLDNETLPAIAKSCNVDLQLLAKVNNLTPPFALKSGTKLFIPNGEKSEAWPSKAHAEAQPIINDNSSDQLLYWPLRGKIISSFHAKRGDHGITIEAPEGTSCTRGRVRKDWIRGDYAVVRQCGVGRTHQSSCYDLRPFAKIIGQRGVHDQSRRPNRNRGNQWQSQ